MSQLENIRNQFTPLLDKVNITIEQSLSTSNPLLEGIVKSFLSKKGKQIRPLFTLLIASLIGEPNSKTISGAAAIELLHNASLIHDDVVDNSDLRRNVETINKIWDNQIAVLVGDFFVTSALDQSLSTGLLEIVESISQLGRKLAVGELDQIYNAQHNILSEEAYLKMIELKTASLFISSARIGSVSVGASPEEISDLTEYARLLGICFQIKDDTFDYCENSSNTLGKPVEADLLEGKISMPLLHVLLEDQKVGKRDYIDLCFKDSLTQQEVKSLIDYTIENKGIEYANEYMESLYKKASGLIDKYPNKVIVDKLNILFRYVIERNH